MKETDLRFKLLVLAYINSDLRQKDLTKEGKEFIDMSLELMREIAKELKEVLDERET